LPVLAPPLAITVNIETEALLEGAGRVVLVFVLAAVTVWLIQRLITPVLRIAVREQMQGEPEIEVSKRISTLSAVIYHTTLVVVAVIAIVTVMPEFGINAGPLIAGLGLVGLAIGFGAQNLVRDVINGLELLIENQYGRGDFVRLRSMTGGFVSGSVEDVNLRRTVLRDFDGTVHFIAHGSVEIASNLTRGFSRVYFRLAVPYESDIARVTAIIDRVGGELAADPAFATLLRQAPRAAGLDRIGDTTVEVRVAGVTEPGEQWTVTGELRRRLKAAFDTEGIHVRDLTE
jgi:small conductance mechanosensitive channel